MPADPLAHLRDIHLPPPLAAWPPALGGILILCLLCLSILLMGVWLLHRYHQQRPQREARALLQDIMRRYREQGHLSSACAEINNVLKRVCLAYYPRTQVASLHGEAWLHFLQSTGFVTPHGISSAREGGSWVNALLNTGDPSSQAPRDDVPDEQDNVPDKQDNVPDKQDDVPDKQDDAPDKQGDAPDKQGDVPGKQGDIPRKLEAYITQLPYQLDLAPTPPAERETTLAPFIKEALRWIKQQRRAR